MNKPSSELKNTTYELFIVALSVLSIINLILYHLFSDPAVYGVADIIDQFLSVIFLGDFLFRFFTASFKSRYFLREFGWADLLASLPFPQVKILRLFRIIRAGRLMRIFGVRNMIHEFLTNRVQTERLVNFVVLHYSGA